MSTFVWNASLACILAFSPAAHAPQEVVVHRSAAPSGVAAWRASLREGRPALRGFRASILERAGGTVSIDLPQDDILRRAASIVARRLAREGLVLTTAAAIEALGASPHEIEGATDRLAAVGLPVDWLEYFRLPSEAHGGSATIVRRIASRLASGASVDSLREELSKASFAFRSSLEGFSVATESGEHDIGLVRLQLTRGTYWTGAGDGGCLDIARQLLAALPAADFVASVEEKHLEKLLETARGWPIGRTGRLTVIPEALPVAQWAQDDGKPGLSPAADGPTPDGGRREVVMLVPRYASRGEDGAAFVPGETFLVDGLASAGHRAAQSPLLFQGGDLLAARDPGTGERWLLIGEANVWRNTALGLAREQVLEAFRVEFGVDRCMVLPAVSFHIDQEMTLRAVGSRLVVFVADPVAAVRIVLLCGVDALVSAGALSSAQAAEAKAHLEAGRDREFLALVVPETSKRCLGFGHFPESLAAAFARGEADSGIGNLQRFLLATDLLTSWSMPIDELPLDPHSVAYLRSLQRRDHDRREMVAELRRSGFEVARVPSLPESDRGIDYLNGLQERARYLMPAWGGLYAPLDRAAEEAFRRALGPGVEVHPILTSESQRRGGALHCSVSVHPRP